MPHSARHAQLHAPKSTPLTAANTRVNPVAEISPAKIVSSTQRFIPVLEDCSGRIKFSKVRKDSFLGVVISLPPE